MSFLVYLSLPPLFFALLISYSSLIRILITKDNFSFFLAGILTYLFFHTVYRKSQNLSKIYILLHELSHAIAGVLKGNRIKKIKISKNYGYVSFSKKPDKLTTIFPYIFPILNIIFAVVYVGINIIFNLSLYKFFLFIQASALMFHILNTFEISLTSQSDFKKFGGRFLSLIIISVLNAFIVALIIITLFPDSTIIKEFILNTVENYIKIILSALKIIVKLLLFVLKLCL